MHFAVFTDDLLGRRSIILEDELQVQGQEHFEANSWEEALTKLGTPAEGYGAAFICLPIHAAYLTFVDDIDMLSIAGPDRIMSQCGFYENISLIYDPQAMKKKKMLNREIVRNGVLQDIIAGDLIVVPEEGNFSYAYELFGKGQVFIYDRKYNDIKTIKCSPMALSVLRENNISIIA